MKHYRVLICFFCLWLGGCSLFQENDNFNQIFELGDTLGNSVLTIQFNKDYSLDEFSPPSPSGFFNYYPREEESDYYIVEGTVTNLSSEPLDLSHLEVIFYGGKSKYYGHTISLAEDESQFIQEIPENVSLPIYFITKVANKDLEEIDSVVLRLNESLSTTNPSMESYKLLIQGE